MAERFRTPALPFLGRLSRRETDSSRFTGLEVEVIGLFDQMRGRMLRYALSFGLPASDAEEVAQDVFLALCQHLSRKTAGRIVRLAVPGHAQFVVEASVGAVANVGGADGPSG